MRRYAGIIKNDIVNGNSVCVSFFLQGCPIRCPGCHNQSDWDFAGGLELPDNYLSAISDAIKANGLIRNFSLLGGEPFCDENIDLSLELLTAVRSEFKDIQICVWSGYTYEDLIQRHDERVGAIFEIADILVDGPFKLELRDVTLKMRGSSNQRIIDLRKSTIHNVVTKQYEY